MAETAKLKGKVALVTGGNSGIGLATAKLFRENGAQIAITGRDVERLRQAQRELGGDTLALQSDAGSLSDIDQVMQCINEHFGRLDVVFANAAIAVPGGFETVTEAQFDDMVNVNFKGVFFTLQKALPLMRQGGSLVVTTSITNRKAAPNFVVYGACKAALRSLVQSAALQLVGRGIRVNAICPGPIATPMYDRFGLPEPAVQAVKNAVLEKSPSKRFGDPEEVAKLALFLACDDSSYITGDEIVIDGGTTLL